MLRPRTAFQHRAQRLSPSHAWRRTLPTRSWSPDEVDHLEWLDDPHRIALFHTPRQPRVRRRRRPPPVPATAAAGMRWEVLRLF